MRIKIIGPIGEGRVEGGDRRQIQLVSTQKLKKHPQRFLNGRLSQRFLSFFHLSSTAGMALKGSLYPVHF